MLSVNDAFRKFRTRLELTDKEQAETVQRALREVRREYGAVGTVHLFAAVPAGLAVMMGQPLNTFGSVQTYEHVPTDGSGCYRQGPLLLPCS